MSEHVPLTLASAVRGGLRPVRRLPPPWQRTLRLLPLGLLTLVAAPLIYEVRIDAPALGWLLTWGASGAEAMVALLLVGLGLREAVPGRALGRRPLLLVVAAALGTLVLVTFRTWSVSPVRIEGYSPAVIGEICFTGMLTTAAPLLAAAAALAARAFVVRPLVAGALYGLGAGVAADAGWRIYCHYSDPAHVLPTHTGAVVVVGCVGMLVAAAARRFGTRAR